MSHDGPSPRFHTAYIYAERRRELVFLDAIVADEWQVLPRQLHSDLDRCSHLIIADPLSFPFEDLRPRDWALPMTVVWPQSVPDDIAIELLDEALLTRLTFFDTLLVADEAKWEKVRSKYRFSESQHRRWRGGPLERVIGRAVRSGYVASRGSDRVTRNRVDHLDPWTFRGPAGKAQHLIELGALAAAVATAESKQPAGRVLNLIHIGTGVGRFASLLSRHSYQGFNNGRALTAQATSNFPSLSIQQLGQRQALPLMKELTDAAVITHHLSRLTPTARTSLLASIWRALRVGGKLIVLDTFAPLHGLPALPTDDLLTDLLDVTDHNIVVSDVASIQSHLSSMRDIGVLTFTKIGIPARC